MGYKYSPLNNSFSFDPEIISPLPQIAWHITSKCLLNCKFCFDEKLNADYEDISEIQKTVVILKELGVQKIDISGGEPLLCTLLKVVIDECVKNKINMTLTTSGFANESEIDWLSKNWKLFSRVIISLDGIGDTHNLLRGNTAAFEAFSNAYSNLSSQGCNILRINSVVTSYLLSEPQRELLIGHIINLNPLEWCIIQPHPLNKKSNYNSVDITASQFEEFRDQCTFALRKTNIKLIYRDNNHYSTYWVLDARGNLKKVSNNKDYSSKVNLFTMDIESIKKIIDGFEINFPEK